MEHLDSVELNLHRLSLELVREELISVLLLVLLRLRIFLNVFEDVKNGVLLDCLEQLLGFLDLILCCLYLGLSHFLIYNDFRRIVLELYVVLLFEVGCRGLVVDAFFGEAVQT